MDLFECDHLSDLCEDLLRVGKVNGTAAGNNGHTGNSLCLLDSMHKNKWKTSVHCVIFLNNNIARCAAYIDGTGKK